jgi:esterase/lipase superfamily enzyme
VHGYNVTFSEAAVSAAHLAAAMQLRITPIVYSWPSLGKASGYWHDEDTARASTLRFTPFLEHLLSGPEDDIIIVCHSMGSRIVTASLGELSRRGVKADRLRKVALAAADISTEEFGEQWPSLRQFRSTQWTLYESSKDLALVLSQVAHRYRRVGDSRDGVYIQTGSDTIDASNISSTFLAWGHSYIVNNSAVASDLSEWVAQDLLPASRGLIRATQAQDVYWTFP